MRPVAHGTFTRNPNKGHVFTVSLSCSAFKEHTDTLTHAVGVFIALMLLQPLCIDVTPIRPSLWALSGEDLSGRDPRPESITALCVLADLTDSVTTAISQFLGTLPPLSVCYCRAAVCQ